jgi:hypothetical protein
MSLQIMVSVVTMSPCMCILEELSVFIFRFKVSVVRIEFVCKGGDDSDPLWGDKSKYSYQ